MAKMDVIKVKAEIGQRVQVRMPDGACIQVRYFGDNKAEVCTPGHVLNAVGKESPTIVKLERGRRRSIMDDLAQLRAD